MNFKKGDRVRVIAGSNKGKEGTITQILKQENILQSPKSPVL